MNQAEFEKVINTIVDAKPTIIYKRIQKLFPQEFGLLADGYETVDSSRIEMKNFLIRKGQARQDFIGLLNKL